MKRMVLILSVFIGIMACQQEDGSKIKKGEEAQFKVLSSTKNSRE